MNWKPNTPWYEKPPLFMWMMAGFMNILDFSSLPSLPEEYLDPRNWEFRL